MSPDDDSGEGIYVDGEAREYQKRRALSLETNGNLRHMRVSINVPLVGSLIASFFAIAGTVYALSVFIFEPRLQRAIGEAIDMKTHSLEAQMIELKASLALTRDENQKLRAWLIMQAASRWTLIDERIQTERIRALNPKLVIPDPVHQQLPGEDP